MAIVNELVRCQGCTYQFGKLIGSRGNHESPLVIIGESPGKMELREGRPFVGPSGELLAEMLKPYAELDPYITNAHQCYPGSTKKKEQEKTALAVKTCQGRLHHELTSRQTKPQIILALGAGALWGVTNNFGLKITQVRGQVFDNPFAERGVVAANHPAYLLRGFGSLRQFRTDVDYACQLALGRRDYRQYIVPKFHVLSTEQEVIELAKLIDDPSLVCASDTETGGYDGFDHIRDHILCSGFCIDPGMVYVLPAELTPFAVHLFGGRCRFVFHNGKFDLKFFRRAGVQNARLDEDTMLLSYTLDTTKGVHDLEQIASDLLGAPDWKFMIKEYINPKRYPKGTVITYDLIPRPVLHDYMSRDISSTLQIFPILRSQVQADKHLEKAYTRTVMPESDYYMEIEENGLKLNLEQVDKNDIRLQGEIAKYNTAINELAQKVGHPQVNPNSPDQLSALMYDAYKFRLPNGKRPTSTDKKTLEKLPQDHPLIINIQKYRKVQKAHSTYVVPAKGWVNQTGRVHTTYLIHGTATGRPASRDPNLLNIPRDPELRGQFEAEGDRILLESDVSQAELRVLTELSQDPTLIQIYTTKGRSIHDTTCDAIFGLIKEYSPEQLAKQEHKFFVFNDLKRLRAEQKMRAKNVNFGIPYGISAFGLAEQIDDTPAVAAEYLDLWYKTYPIARRFLLQIREAASLGKTLITGFGRKKRAGVVSPERLNDLQNEMCNFFMQSIASDIVHHTGFYIRSKIHRGLYPGVKICNTVYDSILFEVPMDKNLIEDLSKDTNERLGIVAKEWGLKTIPFIGEAKIGKRWGNLIDLEEFTWEKAA